VVTFADRVATLNNLRHSVLLKLICKSNALARIRLSLVPKLTSKASTNLGAPRTWAMSRMASLPHNRPTGAMVQRESLEGQ
jgi:hypothetical protein